jgi:hypothetical protein
MTPEETELLQQTVATSTIHVEFGTLYGASAISAAQGGAQIVYTFDPMKGGWWDTGDPHTGLTPCRDYIEKNIAEVGLTHRIHIMQMRSSPWMLEGVVPDSILIDGDHLYDGVYTDWLLASKYARRTVLFHDYDNIHLGVKHVVDEVVKKNLNWTQTALTDTLIVFTRHEQPLVSVIVPTYNRPALLERALKSIVAQTYTNHFAIVVNDGGMDVNGIVGQFENMRYLEHGTNWGSAASSRNTGLRMARGTWIAYLDDDDIWKPDHLSTLMEATHKGARFVYSDAEILRKDIPHQVNKPEIWFSRDFTKQGILSKNVCATCCVLHERSLLSQAGFFDPGLRNHEDWDLWIRMSQICDLVHVKKVTAVVDRSYADIKLTGETEALELGWKLVFDRYTRLRTGIIK